MISELILILEVEADHLRAHQMKAYMKNKFEFYGIPSARRKEISKSFINSFKGSDIDEVKLVVHKLWNHDVRECQYIGMELLDKHLKK